MNKLRQEFKSPQLNREKAFYYLKTYEFDEEKAIEEIRRESSVSILVSKYISMNIDS